MPTDDAQTNGTTPWYAKLARHWGFQATLIFLLVLLLAKIFTGDMVNLRTTLDAGVADQKTIALTSAAIHAQVIENQKVIIEALKSITEMNANVTLVLTQICVQGARSDADRRACFERRR